MKNYHYNGMNATEIAEKIIRYEEAYYALDFEALSFEEKCDYLVHCNKLYHPLLPDSAKIAERLHTLLPELRSRADGGNADAMFYRWALDPDLCGDHDKKKALLEKASSLGSVYAQIVCTYDRRSENDAHALLTDILNRLKTEPKVPGNERALFKCYSILSEIAPTEEERADCKAFCDELALAAVLRGEHARLVHLCLKNIPRPIRRTDVVSFDEETLFWKTVEFLTEAHFYEKWDACESDKHGIHLIRGIGCDPDAEAAKRFYLDRYRKMHFDRSRLLAVLEISDESGLNDTKLRLQKEIDEGNADDYWRLILTVILQNEADELERLCSVAIEKNPDKLMAGLHRAYDKLSTSK